MLINELATSPALFMTTVAVLGLMVGSFLNVVIHRLPKIMDRQWRSQCEELLHGAVPAPATRYNLLMPGSACPHCGHKIRAWENIPVISYLLLRGKCSSCGARISPRYPIIELVTGALSLAVAWWFGYGWTAAGALLLTWSLIALTMIDFDTQLLPDSITLPLLWLGLLFNMGDTFTGLDSAVIGAVAGYLALWLVYWAFKLTTGKEGMGYGDFKLLAMLGAWLGWTMLPLIILLSSVVGAVVGITLILALGRDRHIPIPFGPYLAAAGFIALLWGERLVEMYLQFTRVG